MSVPDYCTPTDRGPCEDCGESGVVWEDGFVLCDDCARLRCARHKLEQERARRIDGTHPAACGPRCRSQHTDDHSQCPEQSDGPES